MDRSRKYRTRAQIEREQEHEARDARAWARRNLLDPVRTTREMDDPRDDVGRSTRDDVQKQDAERHGGRDGASVRVLSIHGLDFEPSADVTFETVSAAHMGRHGYDDAQGPGILGAWAHERSGALWRKREPEDGVESYAVRAVRKVVADLPPKYAATFDAIFVQQLTERDAADALGIAPSTMHERVERLRATVADALGDLGPEHFG
jgi:hypothetical protein